MGVPGEGGATKTTGLQDTDRESDKVTATTPSIAAPTTPTSPAGTTPKTIVGFNHADIVNPSNSANLLALLALPTKTKLILLLLVLLIISLIAIMIALAVLLAATSSTATVAAAAASTIDMRLMTYNIRYATTSPSTDEELWSVRSPLLASQLNLETAGRENGMMCFQEALWEQVSDVYANLNSLSSSSLPSSVAADENTAAEWDFVGVGRTDGAFSGEFSPIFYRPSIWSLRENATYWLSENPTIAGTVGWDAALPRIATVAKFEHVGTKAGLVLMCTHFDHKGETARVESAKLLVEIAGNWTSSSGDEGGYHVFLGGDLNVAPDDEAYLVLAGDMTDVKDAVAEGSRAGNENTYTGFTANTSDDKVIDHLFLAVGDADEIGWRSYAVLGNKFDDEVWISDHRGVVVDFSMPVGSTGNRDSTTLKAVIGPPMSRHTLTAG
ncbi:hypothetical protein MKZ38_009459 [Zalerion maritima]|uniref:Endonuclease/exonuclease/phosphatase domain-containing protein n=1 Tax=Zalerion maritima TaxID=339359 RepID=A0AAD5RV86_9PEZI|nr:hypothetical protein MKZ38_009459 [Zalerion maritima]